MAQTRKRTRTAARVILILKQACFRVRQHETLAQNMAMTLVTGVHKRVTCCSPSKSSAKKKKNRSTSQLHFCSENTPTLIGGDQIHLTLRQLANNTSFANFHTNNNRISKLPKSLITTMATFYGKSEKFKLFEDFFRTSFKNHKQLTEDGRSNYFHSLMTEMQNRH